MRLRAVISRGWVLLAAALITGVALVLGSGSTNPAPRRSQVTARLVMSWGSQVGGGTAAAPYALMPTTTEPTKAKLAQMRRHVRLVTRLCGAGDSGPLSSSPAPVLSSAHGRIRVNLYLSGHVAVMCSSNSAVGGELTPVTSHRPKADAIAITGVTGDANGSHRTTIEYGRIGASVHGVRFVLADGASVTAAVGSSWFLVWWPSGSSPKRAVLRTAYGTRTLALGAAAASPATDCGGRKGCFATVSPPAGHSLG